MLVYIGALTSVSGAIGIDILLAMHTVVLAFYTFLCK